MNRYAITSVSFQGEVVYTFGHDGRLCEFSIAAELNLTQYHWFLTHQPTCYEDLKKLAQQCRGQMREIPVDLSFKVFWDTYAYKVGSKGKCESAWNKMSEGERALALAKISAYKIWAKNKNIDLVYPERYLIQKRYDNEFRV